MQSQIHPWHNAGLPNQMPRSRHEAEPVRRVGLPSAATAALCFSSERTPGEHFLETSSPCSRRRVFSKGRSLHCEAGSTNADGTVCHISERYVDSAAVLTHLATFGEKFANRFMEVLKPTRLFVYGSPNAAVKEALAGFNPVYMESVGSISR